MFEHRGQALIKPLFDHLARPFASALLCWCGAGLAQSNTDALATTARHTAQAQLATFGEAGARRVNPAWESEGLPADKAPRTQFDWVQLGQDWALRLRTDGSYGLLRHAWQDAHPALLTWRWRLDAPLDKADINTREGDDAALKICVMFDQPLADIPVFQRVALTLARQVSGKDLPSATLCYLWDSRYPSGQVGSNPYSARVRYMVINGAASPLGQWRSHSRNLAADFAQLFGKESQLTPNVSAVVIGADSDNTRGRSLAYVQSLQWQTP